MPVTNYIGKSKSAIGNPRLTELIAALPGYLPSDSTHAIKFHYHGQKGAITGDPEAWTGAAEDQLAHGGSKLGVNFPVWSNDIRLFHVLCVLAAGDLNLFAQDENANFINLVPVTNGDFITSPDGALYDSMALVGTKYTNNDKEGKIDILAQGYTYPATEKWISSNFASYLSTEAQVTGGSGTALPSTTNTRAGLVLPNGFNTVTRLGHDVGNIESASLEIELISHPLQMNGHVIRQAKITAKWKTVTFNATQLSASADDRMTDGALTMLGNSGQLFTFNNIRGLVKQYYAANDQAYLEGTFGGNCSLTAIDWTTPTAPVFTMNNL